LVSKTKGTDAADPVAESETEMLVSQTPSLFKRGILMDAIPWAHEIESTKTQHANITNCDIICCTCPRKHKHKHKHARAHEQQKQQTRSALQPSLLKNGVLMIEARRNAGAEQPRQAQQLQLQLLAVVENRWVESVRVRRTTG